MTRLRITFTALCIVALWLLGVGLTGQQRQSSNTGVISRIVVDENGTPVSEAEVDAENTEGSAGSKALGLALTDSSGAFAFNPIGFGTYKFYALKPESGYPDTKFEIYAESYHKTMATVSAVTPNALITIVVGPRAGIVRLKVLDRSTHEPISDPTLVLRRQDTNVWVSASQTNNSLILVPPAVPTQLTVQAKGYATWRNYDLNNPSSAALIVVDSGREIQMTVELDHSGTQEN